MSMWDCLIDHARFISVDTKEYEMGQCIVALFYRAMAGTFRFLRMNRSENDDYYIKFDLRIYGIITAYTEYFLRISPSVKKVDAYFFEVSVCVTNNLRRFFFAEHYWIIRLCMRNITVIQSLGTLMSVWTMILKTAICCRLRKNLEP